MFLKLGWQVVKLRIEEKSQGNRNLMEKPKLLIDPPKSVPPKKVTAGVTSHMSPTNMSFNKMRCCFFQLSKSQKPTSRVLKGTVFSSETSTKLRGILMNENMGRLGGGFQYFLFSPLFGEDFQFD